MLQTTASSHHIADHTNWTTCYRCHRQMSKIIGIQHLHDFASMLNPFSRLKLHYQRSLRETFTCRLLDEIRIGDVKTRTSSTFGNEQLKKTASDRFAKCEIRTSMQYVADKY